jgi:hypothetical protein
MLEQSLLSAVVSQFRKSGWPEEEVAFSCDPDGEVRGTTGIAFDFYPKIEVREEDRAEYFGDIVPNVTKEMFEEAIKNA